MKPGSAAARAGILVGDTIIELEGAPLGPQEPETKASVTELSYLLEERGDVRTAAKLRHRFDCEFIPAEEFIARITCEQ